MNVDKHLEEHLGPIANGWRAVDDRNGLSVAAFPEQPSPGVTTLATLGLSYHLLDQGESQIRQELLLGFHGDHSTGVLSMLLVHLAERLLTNHRAIRRGEVVPLGYPIVNGSMARCVYACAPCVYAHGLELCSTTSPPTIIVWLIPVLPSEVAYINAHGWSSFEDQLERHDPDLFDLLRDPIC